MARTKNYNKRFELRLNTKDLHRLQKLIDHYESNGSDVIRQLIKKEYNTLVDKVTDTEHKQ